MAHTKADQTQKIQSRGVQYRKIKNRALMTFDDLRLQIEDGIIARHLCICFQFLVFAVADQSPLNFVGNVRRFSVVIVGLFSVVMLMTVLLIVIRVRTACY